MKFKAVSWHLGKHAEEWTKHAAGCRPKFSVFHNLFQEMYVRR